MGTNSLLRYFHIFGEMRYYYYPEPTMKKSMINLTHISYGSHHLHMLHSQAKKSEVLQPKGHWVRLQQAEKSLNRLQVTFLPCYKMFAILGSSTQKRRFKQHWSDNCLFRNFKDKAVYFISKEITTVFKEYNIQQHYEQTHAPKCHT